MTPALKVGAESGHLRSTVRRSLLAPKPEECGRVEGAWTFDDTRDVLLSEDGLTLPFGFAQTTSQQDERRARSHRHVPVGFGALDGHGVRKGFDDDFTKPGRKHLFPKELRVLQTEPIGLWRLAARIGGSQRTKHQLHERRLVDWCPR